jgi:tetratricopeptide (TPR) repeat protein
LSEQLGEDAEQMEAMLLLAESCFFRRDYSKARELGQHLLELAEAVKATAMVAGAHYVLGTTATWLGELEAAREHLEIAIALFGPGPFRNFGEAQYARFATGALTTTLLQLGYPTAALRKSRESLDAMGRPSVPAAFGSGLLQEAVLHAFVRESSTTPERAEELLLIAAEHGLHFAAAQAAFFRGWALADRGGSTKASPRCYELFPVLRASRQPPGFTADWQRSMGRLAARKRGLRQWLPRLGNWRVAARE